MKILTQFYVIDDQSGDRINLGDGASNSQLLDITDIIGQSNIDTIDHRIARIDRSTTAAIPIVVGMSIGSTRIVLRSPLHHVEYGSASVKVCHRLDYGVITNCCCCWCCI